MKELNTKEEYLARCKSNTIELIGEYKGFYDIHMFKCKSCDHEWEDRPVRLLNKKVCPICFENSTTSPYGDKSERYFIKARAVKMAFIKYKGGACQHCGEGLVEEPWKADFHHIDPEKKDIEINKLNTLGKVAFEELKKTILLCSYCHRKLHAEPERFQKNKALIEKNSESFLQKFKKMEESSE